MSDVPSNLIPTRITQLPTAPVADENSLMMIVYQGNNYQIRVGDLLSVSGVPITRQVIAGTGMTGGGALSSNVTLSVAPGGIDTSLLANSGVTPGVYGSSSQIPILTVDSTGRVTAASATAAAGSGTVTSVAATVPTGLEVAGSPITSTGTLAFSYSIGYSIPTTASQSTWDTAYADRFKWDGGSTGLVAATGRTSLGLGTMATQDASSVSITGGSITGITDLAIADGGTGASTATAAFDALAPTTTKGDLIVRNATVNTRIPVGTDTYILVADSTEAAGIKWAAPPSGSGTVTSVGGTGTVNGITLTGTVTSSGNLTLGGTLSGVSLATQVTGTLPVANGGTGQTTASAAFNALSPVTTTGDLIIGNGTNSATRLAIGANGYLLTSDGTTASWVAAPAGGVTSFSAGTTGLTPATGTTGAVTLAGTLAIANGGTNSTATATAGGAGYGTGTAHAYTAAGTAGQVLTSAGASAPTWSGINGGTF